MTIPFFKKLYKVLGRFLNNPPYDFVIPAFATMTAVNLRIVALGISFASSLHALSPQQELKACKSALLAQLNEQKRLKVQGCPVSQKLVTWLGILRDPHQFTPHELTTFLKNHSHWPHHEKLCRKAEKAIIEKASFQEILAWFGEHPPETPAGVISYAKALLSHNERTKAAKIAITAWKSMELTKSEEKKFMATFGHLLQEKDHIARLQFLLWEGQRDNAKRLLVHVPLNVRKIAEIRIAFLEGKFKPIPSKYAKDEGLLYEVVRYYRKQDAVQEASQILLSLSPSKAYTEKWWKEQNYFARELIALGDYQTAYQLIQRHDLEPGSEDFANAEWLSGWLALRFLNKPKEAQRHFETLFANVQGAVSKARGAYWMGRTYESQAQVDFAGKWYRKGAHYKTTYYGQLAAAKLREKSYPSLTTAPKATSAEKKKFEQKELVKAAHILKGLGKGACHELSKFLLHIADQAKTKGEKELAVHLAHALSPTDIVWVAKKAGYSEPVLLKKAYPLCTIPRKGQAVPEKAFVMAIAYQESRFNPTAKSSAGAVGLLQLIPATAAREAKRLKISHKESKLCDPHHNLLLGTAHLSRMLDHFDKSYILAAAAYNAGHTPVQRWIQQFGDPRQGEIDIVDWIELIPYAETRNYVMRVLENITIYRSLEGQPQKTLLDDLQR